MKEKFVSIFKGKCPVCLNDDVFYVKNPYNLKDFSKMHATCRCCNHKYEAETGYWFGAMYVSYAIGVASSVATFLLTYFADLIFKLDISAFTYFGLIILAIIGLLPINFRLSRLIWMNLFVTYDPVKAALKK